MNSKVLKQLKTRTERNTSAIKTVPIPLHDIIFHFSKRNLHLFVDITRRAFAFSSRPRWLSWCPFSAPSCQRGNKSPPSTELKVTCVETGYVSLNVWWLIGMPPFRQTQAPYGEWNRFFLHCVCPAKTVKVHRRRFVAFLACRKVTFLF